MTVVASSSSIVSLYRDYFVFATGSAATTTKPHDPARVLDDRRTNTETESTRRRPRAAPGNLTRVQRRRVTPKLHAGLHSG